MIKKNKDAQTLACEELNNLIHSPKTNIGCIYDCPAVENCNLSSHTYSNEKCIKTLKQHFQKQANIPDGWDVVKEIYDYVENLSEGIAKQEDKGISYSANGSLKVASLFIENRLKKAGIEVDND